jgi:hypothetical protein
LARTATGPRRSRNDDSHGDLQNGHQNPEHQHHCGELGVPFPVIVEGMNIVEGAASMAATSRSVTLVRGLAGHRHH